MAAKTKGVVKALMAAQAEEGNTAVLEPEAIEAESETAAHREVDPEGEDLVRMISIFPRGPNMVMEGGGKEVTSGKTKDGRTIIHEIQRKPTIIKPRDNVFYVTKEQLEKIKTGYQTSNGQPTCRSGYGTEYMEESEFFRLRDSKDTGERKVARHFARRMMDKREILNVKVKEKRAVLPWEGDDSAS